MNREPAAENQHVAYMQRHVVPIYLHFVRGTEQHAALITSFVLEVRGQWFLVTAAHCINDVQTMMNKGWTLRRSRLIDTMGLGAKYSQPIPFDYLGAAPTAMFQDEKNDYGLLYVDDHDRRLLQANGIEPITEVAWDCNLVEPDGFFLIGIPGQLTTAAPDLACVTTVLLGVKALAVRPPCFDVTDAMRWYGEVLMPRGLRSLEGMSGGPIFAIKRVEGGALKYWLHGIQSAQSPRFPSEPYVAANLARPLARFLAVFMAGKHQDLVDRDSAQSTDG